MYFYMKGIQSNFIYNIQYQGNGYMHFHFAQGYAMKPHSDINSKDAWVLFIQYQQNVYYYYIATATVKNSIIMQKTICMRAEIKAIL